MVASLSPASRRMTSPWMEKRCKGGVDLSAERAHAPNRTDRRSTAAFQFVIPISVYNRSELRFAGAGQGPAQRRSVDFAFPTRDNQRGDAVAQHVNQSAQHAHEPVDP